MMILEKHGFTLLYAAVASLIVGGSGLANYYGYAYFGTSAARVQPVFQAHSYVRFHK
jgi:hypothetical protein